MAPKVKTDLKLFIHMYSKNRQDNLTAILYKTDDIRLEQQDVVEPGPDQVIMHPKYFRTHHTGGSFCIATFSNRFC